MSTKTYYIKALDKTFTERQLAPYIPHPDQIYRKSNPSGDGTYATLFKILKSDGYVAYTTTKADISNAKSLYTSNDRHSILEYNTEHAMPLLEWIEYSISEGLELLDDKDMEAYNEISEIIQKSTSDIISRIESILTMEDGGRKCMVGCDGCYGSRKICFEGNSGGAVHRDDKNR